MERLVLIIPNSHEESWCANIEGKDSKHYSDKVRD